MLLMLMQMLEGGTGGGNQIVRPLAQLGAVKV